MKIKKALEDLSINLNGNIDWLKEEVTGEEVELARNIIKVLEQRHKQWQEKLTPKEQLIEKFRKEIKEIDQNIVEHTGTKKHPFYAVFDEFYKITPTRAESYLR
jgi:hypothetical protein